jgi:hypothetical protein
MEEGYEMRQLLRGPRMSYYDAPPFRLCLVMRTRIKPVRRYVLQ